MAKLWDPYLNRDYEIKPTALVAEARDMLEECNSLPVPCVPVFEYLIDFYEKYHKRELGE